jgi:hypothetical protein
VGIKHFFTALLAVALLFATPNPVARLPFKLGIPLLSTAQPSRLMMLIDFSLVVLAAIGLDAFMLSFFTSEEKPKFIEKKRSSTSEVVQRKLFS